MSETPTDQQLAEWEALEAAATPGRWEAITGDHGRDGLNFSVWAGDADGKYGKYITERVMTSAADAELIAAARSGGSGLMDRESLDEFFARAEDVLTDWQGSTDAMHARVPTSGDVEALPGDSYYDQPTGPIWTPPLSAWVEWAEPDPEVIRQAMAAITESAWHFGEAMTHLRQQCAEQGTTFAALAEAIRRDDPGEIVIGFDRTSAASPRERALELRRTRNTGPADPYRITRRRNQRATR